MKDKIIQVNGFGVNNTENTQCDYLLVAVTESGTVLISTGDGIWSDVGPKESPNLGEICMFNYVDVTGNGYEGWLNLFFGEFCVALIQDVELANMIRKETPNKYNKPMDADEKASR